MFLNNLKTQGNCGADGGEEEVTGEIRLLKVRACPATRMSIRPHIEAIAKFVLASLGSLSRTT
jgi:hypothetical protein